MTGRRAEVLGYVGLTAAALVVRLIALGERPFHHDESQDAYFSWLLFTQGDYEYQPILHGPLRFYLTALVYAVLGDTDATARLAPALMGTAMVPLCALLRGQLGRIAAFATAAALAFGPTYLYYGRFAREDISIACITLALIAVTARFLERPRRHQPALIAGLLAASFATKESTFITVFVAGTFLLGAVALQSRRHGRDGAPILRAVRAVGWEAWGWALATFALVFTLLFTVFLTDPAGLWAGLYEGLTYWLGQHGEGRGEAEWYFYLVVLVAEEWPALALGAIGAVVALRRPTVLRVFLVWDFAVSLAIYSWANERFTWLVMHPLLPLLGLAGLGVQAIWTARRRMLGRAGLVLAVLAVAHVGWASWQATVRHPADPREFLVTTQSSREVLAVRDRVLALADRARREGRSFTVAIDAAQGATFPWAWYFRDLPAAYVDLERAPLPAAADAVILTEGARARQAARLAGYDGRRFGFRVWWVRDYGAMSLGGGWRWLARREPWNPTGGLPEWLYVRQGA